MANSYEYLLTAVSFAGNVFCIFLYLYFFVFVFCIYIFTWPPLAYFLVTVSFACSLGKVITKCQELHWQDPRTFTHEHWTVVPNVFLPTLFAGMTTGMALLPSYSLLSEMSTIRFPISLSQSQSTHTQKTTIWYNFRLPWHLTDWGVHSEAWTHWMPTEDTCE